MSTTVTYKGQTLTTVENQTKTLNTAGTWVEGDFTLTDVTASGGGDEWVRPADFPDLSKMDISGEVLYLSYMANEGNGFCDFAVKTNSGNYTVEIGDIVGDNFVAQDTYTLASNADCKHYFGSPSGGYKVLKITGNIKEFINNSGTGITITAEGEKRYTANSGMAEAYGNLPNHHGEFVWRTLYYVQSIVVRNVEPTSLWYSFQDAESLQNIETKTWDMQYCTNMQVTFRNCKKLRHIDCENWDVSNCTNFNGTFQNCYQLKELDVSAWDTSNATNVTAFASGCWALESFSGATFVKATHTSVADFFRECTFLKNVDISAWNTSNVTSIKNAFGGNRTLETFPLSNADLSAVTDSDGYLNSAYSFVSITVPASLPIIGAQAFYGCRCEEFHFLATTPPTLKNTNAFGLTSNDKKIYVPYSADHSVLNAYQTATNWSTYASYIVEEDA